MKNPNKSWIYWTLFNWISLKSLGQSAHSLPHILNEFYPRNKNAHIQNLRKMYSTLPTPIDWIDIDTGCLFDWNCVRTNMCRAYVYAMACMMAKIPDKIHIDLLRTKITKPDKWMKCHTSNGLNWLFYLRIIFRLSSDMITTPNWAVLHSQNDDADRLANKRNNISFFPIVLIDLFILKLISFYLKKK